MLSVESIGSQLGLGNADLRTIVVSTINGILGVLNLITLIMFMFGGLQWVIYGKNDMLREQAATTLKNALIGQVIILLAWGLTRAVLNWFSQ